MKKLLLLLLPLCGVFAQTRDIKPGVYHSNSMGTDFIMRLNEDSSYELVFLHGNYTKEGDTIQLNTTKNAGGDFTVTPVARDKSASSLKITFKNAEARYMLSGLYIGTQHSDSRPPEYKSIHQYFRREDMVDMSDDEPLSVSIDKTKFLYFTNYRGYYGTRRKDKVAISRFEIPDDVSEIEVETSGNKMGDLNFRLFKNERNQLVLSEGNTPRPFIFMSMNDGTENPANQLPVQLIEDADFAKNAGLVADTDEIVEETIEETAPSFTFKYTIEKTFAEAQKTAAKSKDKFLVVAFDYENKKAQTDFDKFIKRTETQIGYSMPEEYDEAADHFNFYLASDKDKGLLAKNKFDAKKPQILVFNSEGDLIYHTSNTLRKSGYFGNYDSAFDEFQQASQYLKLDRAIAAKKVTVPELVKAFKLVLKVDKPYNAYAAVADTVALEAPYDDAVETAVAVDTTVVDYSDYSGQSVIADAENLYKLKATRDVVNAKWAQIVAFYKKSNTYDQDFIDLGLSELYNEGFTSRLFKESDNKIEAVKFDFLDYVFAHYEEIGKAEKGFGEAEEAELHYTDNDVDVVLESFFIDYANDEGSDKSQSDKMRQYYKKYIGLSGESAAALQSYFDFVQNTLSPATEREYLDIYEKLFDSVMKPGTGVIENLDRAFSEGSEFSNWTNFKYEFANNANSVAWYVVEHRLGKTDIQKAVTWSETSLKIQPENAYYLDTLAQLYYLDGQKQQAMATEARAAAAAAKMDDEDTKLKYEQVLESMKNGTY